MDASKRCTKCGEVKYLSEFHRETATPGGLKRACKVCTNRARKLNRVQNAERERAYAAAHPMPADLMRAYAAAYRDRHRERVRDQGRRKRARERGVVVTEIDFDVIWSRDDGNCQLCMEPIDTSIPWPDGRSLSIDHTIPISLGGSHTVDNVTLAHLYCNKSKGNKIA